MKDIPYTGASRMVEVLRRKRIVSTAVMAVIFAATFGCSGSTSSPATTTTASVSQPATTSPSTATNSTSTLRTGTTAVGATGTSAPGQWSADQQQVIDAYVAGQKAYRKAAMISDPESPVLATTTSGVLLTTVKRELTQRKAAGIATKSPPNSKAAVQILSVTTSGNNADLSSCEVDDTIVYHVGDGSIVNADVGTIRYAAHLELQDGTWKVAARNQVGNILPGEEMQTCVAQR